MRGGRRCFKVGSAQRRVLDLLKCIDIERHEDGSAKLVWCYWCHEEAEHWIDAMAMSPTHCTQQEGKVKVPAVADEYCFTLAWTVVALNPWGYIDLIERKILLLSLVDNSVAAMLEGIRRGVGLSLGLEALLARQIAANPEDISSRNQLKLVRLCKVFGTPGPNLSLVLTVVSSGLLNDLFVNSVGCPELGAERLPATLLEFVDPDGSPIAFLQLRILELLDDFAAGAASWHLLALLGVDFQCEDVRLQARASLLRMHAGLIHHFEKLLGSAPYSLLLTLPQVNVERDVTDAVISVFVFRTPVVLEFNWSSHARSVQEAR